MSKNKYIIIFTSTILVLFLIRIALPQYFKYLLFPVISIYFGLSLIGLFRNNDLFRGYNLQLFNSFIILFLLYIFAYIITYDRPFGLYKDFVNNIFVFLFISALFIFDLNKHIFFKIIKIFQVFIVILGFLFAALGIIKLLLQLNGIYINYLAVNDGYPLGTSLSMDNNFFSLFCLISLIFIVPFLFVKQKKVRSIGFQIILFILMLNIILTTSRRGLVFAFVFFSLTVFIWLSSFIFKSIKIKNFRFNTTVFIALTIMFLLSFYYLFFKISSVNRNRWLVNSSLNYTEFQDYVEKLVFNGRTIFKGESTFKNVNQELWQTHFDSRFPYTGWAIGNYSLINNLNIGNDVPSDAKGAMINKHVSTFETNKKNYYFAKLFEGSKNNYYRAIISVYCFVSTDFNGGSVGLRTSGDVSGLSNINYDIQKKGNWQKLYLSFSVNEGDYLSYFYIQGKENSKFNNTIGYVIYAYPKISFLNFDSFNPLTWAERKFKFVNYKNLPHYSALPFGANGYMIDCESEFVKSNSISNYFSYTTVGKKRHQLGERYISSIYCYASNDFSGVNLSLKAWGWNKGDIRTFYDVSRKGEWQRLVLNNYGDSSFTHSFVYFEIPNKQNIDQLQGYVIFASPDFKTINYSPNNPDSYVYNIFKKEFPLEGKNSKIVPKSAVGCRFDKHARGIVWNNNCILSTDFNILSVQSGDSISSSVYCFVADDFNGSDVRIEIKGNSDDNLYDRYDLNNKGKWVKLEIKSIAKTPGQIIGRFSFFQRNVNDFNNLKGYVTFAYPEIKLIKKTNKSLSIRNESWKDFVLNKATFYPEFLSINSDQPNCSLSRDSLCEVPVFQKKLEDDNFSGPRLDRWRYAVYLYRYEYKWWQKIIGGGFGYTRKFAKEFNDPDEYDYPHNPFLGVLLYSGILGLIAYIWFLYKSVYYYWIYRKEYWTLGLAFCASFFFAFFSANTPFDPAIMGILTILPYFIHYYTLKEQNAANE